MVTPGMGLEGATGKEQVGSTGVMGLFCILIGVVVIWVATFVKIHQPRLLKCMHFII